MNDRQKYKFSEDEYMLLTKEAFINYIKFFPSMTLEEELLGYYYSYSNGMNDISGIEHTDEEFSLEKVENVEYYWSEKEVLTTDNIPELAYFVFVKIGETKDRCPIGIAFFMYNDILLKMLNNAKTIEIREYDYCISKEQLSRMKVLV